jgi:hypothetical protein
MFSILRLDGLRLLYLAGITSGSSWALANMRPVTECWDGSRVCYLELHIVTLYIGYPVRMLRLKADEVRAAVREVNRANWWAA